MTNPIRRSLRQLSFLPDVCVVGGAVRDALIGRDSDDIDLATSAEPKEVKRLAERRGWRAVDTGIDHGTVTLLASGLEYEVTTFRRDVSTDGRNATVEFADSVEEDLKRRDFTINAMAARQAGSHLQIVDPFGGQKDIEAKTIRTVGDPRARFEEDLLRIVRAIRFSCRYGFEVETETAEAMESITGNRDVTKTLSAERITEEMKKAFADLRPKEFVSRLEEKHGILSSLLEKDIWRFKSDFHKTNRKEDRFLVFLWDLMTTPFLDPETVQSQMKLSNEAVKRAQRVGQPLFLLQDPVPEKTRRVVLAEFRDELEAIQRIGPQLGIPAPRLRKPEEVPLKPVVTGQDLIDRGLEQGPQIGEILDRARELQIREKIADKEKLIDRALSA